MLKALFVVAALLLSPAISQAQTNECNTHAVELISTLAQAHIPGTLSKDKDIVFNAVRAANAKGFVINFPMDLQFDFFVSFPNPNNAEQVIMAPVKDGCVLGYLSLDKAFVQ